MKLCTVSHQTWKYIAKTEVDIFVNGHRLDGRSLIKLTNKCLKASFLVCSRKEIRMKRFWTCFIIISAYDKFLACDVTSLIYCFLDRIFTVDPGQIFKIDAMVTFYGSLNKYTFLLTRYSRLFFYFLGPPFNV